MIPIEENFMLFGYPAKVHGRQAVVVEVELRDGTKCFAALTLKPNFDMHSKSGLVFEADDYGPILDAINEAQIQGH